MEKDTVHKCSAAATGLLPNDSIRESSFNMTREGMKILRGGSENF